jgi:hypothetical protein
MSACWHLRPAQCRLQPGWMRLMATSVQIRFWRRSGGGLAVVLPGSDGELPAAGLAHDLIGHAAQDQAGGWSARDGGSARSGPRATRLPATRSPQPHGRAGHPPQRCWPAGRRRPRPSAVRPRARPRPRRPGPPPRRPSPGRTSRIWAAAGRRSVGGPGAARRRPVRSSAPAASAGSDSPGGSTGTRIQRNEEPPPCSSVKCARCVRPRRRRRADRTASAAMTRSGA